MMLTAAAPLDTAEHLEALTQVNLDDLSDALGITRGGRVARIVRGLGYERARDFAQRTLAFNDLILSAGLQAAARWGLTAFHTELQVKDADSLPATGPLVILANHPGMADTLALMASIERSDLRVLAARRPFLELLPNLHRYLIWVGNEAGAGILLLRRVTRHLRNGGAILTFPAGAIEADPLRVNVASTADTIASLAHWNPSTDLLGSSVPQLQVAVAAIGGVFNRRAARTPLRNLRRSPAERDQLSAMVQLGIPGYKAATAHLHFANLTLSTADQFDAKGRVPVTALAIARMKILLSTMRNV